MGSKALTEGMSWKGILSFTFPIFMGLLLQQLYNTVDTWTGSEQLKMRMILMKKKFICKIVIDMVMTILLLFLMARQITGELAHEWLGAGMFVLWIAHHILNRNWHCQLFRGKYTPMRIMQIVTNITVLFSMVFPSVHGGSFYSRIWCLCYWKKSDFVLSVFKITFCFL